MEKQLTAMQELIEYFTNSNSFWFSFDEVEQIILDFGILKEKQQIINAFNNGTKTRYTQGAVMLGLSTLPKNINTAEQYYNETYGSKGSDEIEKSEKPINLTSSQTEISDEEIHKAATNYSNLYYEFRAGAEWYREQLRTKQ